MTTVNCPHTFLSTFGSPECVARCAPLPPLTPALLRAPALGRDTVHEDVTDPGLQGVRAGRVTYVESIFFAGGFVT